MLADVASGHRGGVADVAVVCAFFYTHTPPLAAGTGGVLQPFLPDMRIMWIMLNILCNVINGLVLLMLGMMRQTQHVVPEYCN